MGTLMISRRTILLGASTMVVPRSSGAQPAVMTTQPFEFISGDNRLSGFLDVPVDRDAKATVIIIHGYGKTDVAGGTSYYDLRSRFTKLGISTAIWDKPGCGKSQGTFDIDQPVASSAGEVLDAVKQLRDGRTPGSQKIGLWGISRAGWIAPMAMANDPGIAFWISVSGTDDKENFPYFLESNLRIEGRTEPQIAQLVGDWKRGFDITRTGGSFDAYLAATQVLRRDPFMIFVSGGAEPTEDGFRRTQQKFMSGEFQVDPETGLQVYVPHFQKMLSGLNVPVLAIFGEKDRNVDWRKTKALYAATLGDHLMIRTFADGNHNIQQAETGGYREMLTMTEHRACNGYYETMEAWLRTVT
jgi:pimeloyl-ACP methyl ester carboxylesterase